MEHHRQLLPEGTEFEAATPLVMDQKAAQLHLLRLSCLLPKPQQQLLAQEGRTRAAYAGALRLGRGPRPPATRPIGRAEYGRTRAPASGRSKPRLDALKNACAVPPLQSIAARGTAAAKGM